YELHLCFSDFTTGQCCDVQFDCLKVLNFQLDVAALKGSDESRIRMKGCLKREIAISSRQPKTPACFGGFCLDGQIRQSHPIDDRRIVPINNGQMKCVVAI